jgi:phage terminase large subunit-like protein
MSYELDGIATIGWPTTEFPQTPANLTEASQNLFELIQDRNLVAYPDAGMRLAISRAVALETSRGWRITEEKQAHKIDVVVALAMAAHAAVIAAIKGVLQAALDRDAYSTMARAVAAATASR